VVGDLIPDAIGCTAMQPFAPGRGTDPFPSRG
jgi:hypothetical protein